jgi:hypothetical protein
VKGLDKRGEDGGEEIFHGLKFAFFVMNNHNNWLPVHNWNPEEAVKMGARFIHFSQKKQQPRISQDSITG